MAFTDIENETDIWLSMQGSIIFTKHLTESGSKQMQCCELALETFYFSLS